MAAAGALPAQRAQRTNAHWRSVQRLLDLPSTHHKEPPLAVCSPLPPERAATVPWQSLPSVGTHTYDLFWNRSCNAVEVSGVGRAFGAHSSLQQLLSKQ